MDVWATFQNGELVEQLEDQKFTGRISARYLFKSGQVTGQEQVADADPPSRAAAFTAIDDELRSMRVAATPEAARTVVAR